MNESQHESAEIEARIKRIQAYMLEEVEAFTKAGNCPFTEDDLKHAAFLRERIDFYRAFLNTLRQGKITCSELNRENFEESTFVPGEHADSEAAA